MEARKVGRFASLPALRAFRHRDFRLLWAGAVVSFTGSQIQGLAQGFLVYELTGDKALLAFVMFANMVPVSLLGPVFGVFADVMDRRKVLVTSMVVFGLASAFLGYAAHQGFIQYWHIIAAALVNGLLMTIETPARQSIVREVVPPEDLSAAIPSMGMTFNLARIVGPAIGGLLVFYLGTESCFWINAVSYGALIVAALAIKTDLSAKEREPQPIRDLLAEGMLYTLRERTLRTLFFLECVTSVFGVWYMALMPAIAKDVLGLDEKGLGIGMSCIGIGAISALIMLASLSQRRYKALLIRIAMTVFTLALLGLSFVTVPWVAFILVGCLGAAMMTQFNTTNTLFQMISPARLRGRVLSMHMWAISGATPFGIILFGWVSREASLQVAFWIGGAAVGVGAIASWRLRTHVTEPELYAAYASKS
jgi:MFS family permease